MPRALGRDRIPDGSPLDSVWPRCRHPRSCTTCVAASPLRRSTIWGLQLQASARRRSRWVSCETTRQCPRPLGTRRPGGRGGSPASDDAGSAGEDSTRHPRPYRLLHSWEVDRLAPPGARRWIDRRGRGRRGTSGCPRGSVPDCAAGAASRPQGVTSVRSVHGCVAAQRDAIGDGGGARAVPSPQLEPRRVPTLLTSTAITVTRYS
jgi:hypothetical protein